MPKSRLLQLFLYLFFVACSKVGVHDDTLFTTMSPDATNINFTNELVFDEDFNIFTYRNFYNGGGVALGDINQDGLLDIYLTANQKSNRLYLNQGGFKFLDITEKAGVGGTRAWSTGVAMADVDGDGLLDIYVCNSGDVKGDNKQNELYINNGDLTFSEKAEDYGIADRGFSTHAAFFDYDKDGDLDLYLLNNSYQAIGSFNLRKNERPNRDPVGGDKFFRNDDNGFVDISEEVGVYGSVIGFGLGVTVGDVNGDNWQDIYVSNDFFERDYLYINNQDGTFKEDLENQMMSISAASMGADMADINNDGYPEIFVTEMLPERNERLKTVTTFESWDNYQNKLKNDYYHQFTRNMFHLNNGDGTFSEVGRLANVEATDWSWAALIFDFENDGHKDIFVANGVHQDMTNLDYLNFMSNEEIAKTIKKGGKVDYKRLVEGMPSVRVPNYAFSNTQRQTNAELSFSNKAETLGLAEPSHSNGSAYGDLDNDGDLDLIVNNVNMPLFVYKNNTETIYPDNHYLRVVLKGASQNPYAIGSKVILQSEGQSFYAEEMPIRGFQSTMDHRITFGLGNLSSIDSVMVTWPDGQKTVLSNIQANQEIIIDYSEVSKIQNDSQVQRETIFKSVEKTPFTFSHEENYFVDFDRDRLLYHMTSTEGPQSTVGDVNGDGLEDIYFCGAKDKAGQLFIREQSGRFNQSNQSIFELDALSEDTDCAFFDSDGDGDLDLYVASGGNEFPTSSIALKDRLYLNDGFGKFTKSSQQLPTNKFESTACVRPNDYDQDGDIDLFVGIRLEPFAYGRAVNGYLLENDGLGNYTNITERIAPDLLDVGMITDAKWVDINKDHQKDLIIVGEWMSPKILINKGKRFLDKSVDFGIDSLRGWWNTIEYGDLNGDDFPDFVLGNHGTNSRFKIEGDRTLKMYIDDFDSNGDIEQVITHFQDDQEFPFVLKHDLEMQMPSIKKRYLKYESFKNQTIDLIFSEEQLERAEVLEVNYLHSAIWMSRSDGSYELQPLSIQAQLSPIYSVSIYDYDHDSQPDILLGGNLYNVKPEVGRYDAHYGLLLKGNGMGEFKVLKSTESGVKIRGQIRDFEILDDRILMVVRNDETALFYNF